jgi:hypothetical protein
LKGGKNNKKKIAISIKKNENLNGFGIKKLKFENISKLHIAERIKLE